jgi:dienelactone hydrolase
MTAMVSTLVAGPPLEPPRHRVGRRTSVLVDGSRADRVVPVDVWYPAAVGPPGELSRYELLPGVGFTASAAHEVAVAAGSHPLVLWSHGRSGTRSSYALLCEAIAARGFVVVAPEHGGDSLADWLLGTFVDDDTNERNRVADARFVLDAVFDPDGPLQPVAASVDRGRVAVAGHSYGGFTALSLAGGTDPDPRVGAVAGLQSLTRSIPARVFEQVEIPTLLITGSHDATTPPVTDADRAWATLGSRPAWRVDIERAGHQGCSDVGLYLELAPHVRELPDVVDDYLTSMAADVTGTAGDPWRPTVALHVRILAAFLDGALGIDTVSASRELDAVSILAGVGVSHRGSFGAGAAVTGRPAEGTSNDAAGYVGGGSARDST